MGIDYEVLSQLVVLVSPLLLLGVTGWYALLTKRLADSSERSAQHALEAAEASRLAAQIAQAGARVSFDISPRYHMAFDDAAVASSGALITPIFDGITLSSEGANLFIHGAGIRHVGERHVDGYNNLLNIECDLTEDNGMRLPVRLHAGELMHLLLPLGMERELNISSVTEIAASISYSFDGGEDVRNIDVEYVGRPGEDYEIEDLWTPIRQRVQGLWFEARQLARYGAVPPRIPPYLFRRRR